MKEPSASRCHLRGIGLWAFHRAGDYVIEFLDVMHRWYIDNSVQINIVTPIDEVLDSHIVEMLAKVII